MGGSWVSGEAPVRRDGRAVLPVDGPRASLDRAVGTNQEIWRGSRRTEASRLCLAWPTGSLQPWLCCRLQWGMGSAAGVCQWWTPERALFSNFLPTLTALRRGLPTVLTNATNPGRDRQKTLAWCGKWQVVRPALPRVAARAVNAR